MKTILLPALMLLFASCSSEDKTTSNTKATKAESQTEETPSDAPVVSKVNHDEIAGVYQNVGLPNVQMDLVQDGDNNYIARYRVEGQSDFYFFTLNGYLIQDGVAYHFSGPFQEIGPEAYFKMINGQRHFYHELSAAYQAPEDTTAMLFKKIADVDASNAITKAERNGLEGPVGMKQRYIVGIVKELKKTGNNWQLVFEKTPREVENDYGQKEFLIEVKGKKSTDSVNGFLQSFGTNPSSAKGKMVKVVMLANGTPPGECMQEPNGQITCSIVKEIYLID